ncbi:MAG TPA: tetratricopeptide repeat protein, partial [Humisphaera sp.]
MSYLRLPPLVLAAALAAALAAVAGGCASGDKKPTEKELAQKRWAAARANVVVTLAKDQYKNGQFDKARTSADEALRLAPENPEAHLVSARLYVEQGQLEAAERELATVRQLAPNNGEAYYMSGVVMQRWQKHEQAYENYKAAAEKSPAEIAYVMAEAEALVTLDRAPDALALLQSKADYFEHSGTIRDAVGQLLMQQGKHAEAARAFRQASILAEDDLGVRERLGLALQRCKEYREAADVLSKLLQNDAFAKRPDLFAALGECQLAAGQVREARFSYETATTLDPYSPTAWRGLGRAALEAGDLRRAELALARSLKYEPNAGEAHLLMGYLKVRQERFDDARRSFESAAALDPRDTVALCMIGYTHEKQGRRDQAARFY